MCRSKTHSDQAEDGRRCSCCDPMARRADRRVKRIQERGHEGDVDEDYAAAKVPERVARSADQCAATYDPSPTVRTARALRGTLSPDEEDILTGDEHPKVRAALASNPDIDATTLDVLADDEDRHVREAVARHPSAPAAALTRMASHLDRRRDLRLAHVLAKHPNTPNMAFEQWTRSGTAGQAAIAKDALVRREQSTIRKS